MIYYILYDSPIGLLTVASDGENIIGLCIENQKYFMSTVSGDVIETNDLLVLNDAKRCLDRYFNGERPKIEELSLKLNGTEFRLSVWKILCEIQYGQVVTYKDISKKVSQIMNKYKISSQAI